MTVKYSRNEIVSMLTRKMQEWIDEGFSAGDAAVIVAKLTQADPVKVLDLYLDGNVQES